MKTKHFLNCELTEVKTQDISDKYFMFEGYASTFGNKDRGNDIVLRGAFTDTIRKMESKVVPIKGTEFSKMMPVLWQHNWDQPIGSFVEMREDEKGLYVKAILPKGDDFVKGRVIPQMEAGSISDMSIGYVIEKESFNGNIRSIEKAELFETSLVTIPMNADAVITGFKSSGIQDLPVAPMGTHWDHDGAQKRHEGKDVHDSAYLFTKEKDGVTECLLPIADILDGKLTIIPDAIFRSAFLVQKGIDGVNEYEHEAIKKTIADYYVKMNLESPYKENGTFRADNVKLLSERELETLLKGGVCFSQKQAKAFVSLLNDDGQRDVDEKSQRDAELKDTLTKLNETLKTL